MTDVELLRSIGEGEEVNGEPTGSGDQLVAIAIRYAAMEKALYEIGTECRMNCPLKNEKSCMAEDIARRALGEVKP